MAVANPRIGKMKECYPLVWLWYHVIGEYFLYITQWSTIFICNSSYDYES